MILKIIDLPGCCFNQSFTPVPPSAAGDSGSKSARLEKKTIMIFFMLFDADSDDEGGANQLA